MNSLKVSAERLKAALNDYVAVLSRHADDPPQVMAGVTRLQDAIRSFAETSAELTGWGSPFVTPNEEADRSPNPEPAQGNEVVGVDAHYLVRVTDAPRLGRFVAQLRGGTRGDLVEQIEPPAALINEIFANDGWNPHKYQGEGLDVLEAKWAVFPAANAIEP